MLDPGGGEGGSLDQFTCLARIVHSHGWSLTEVDGNAASFVHFIVSEGTRKDDWVASLPLSSHSISRT